MSDLHDLEERYFCKLRLFNALYGYATRDHAHWATSYLPFYCVEPYMRAWRHGKRSNWNRLKHHAERIRSASGLDGEAWSAYLVHLEALAGVETSAMHPTTQAMPF